MGGGFLMLLSLFAFFICWSHISISRKAVVGYKFKVNIPVMQDLN